MEVLDTAGPNEYTALRDQWMIDNEGFVFVYSITRKQTLEEVESFHEQLFRIYSHKINIPMILIGNQADKEERREVSKEEGQEFARKRNMDFYETSSKTNQNLEVVFKEICKKILLNRNNFYFTGKGIEKLFKMGKINCFGCKIPFYNKNLKNIWLIIFKLVLLHDPSKRLAFKLVCRHWYSIITENFERKYTKKILAFQKTQFLISTVESPINMNIVKYIFVIDFCDYLNESPQTHIKTLEQIKLDNKDILIVFFNTKLFKQLFGKEPNKNQTHLTHRNAKKNIEELVKQFSKWNNFAVEDLSSKNIQKIFDKIDPKNCKEIIKTLK